jgi:hypothetical protein
MVTLLTLYGIRKIFRKIVMFFGELQQPELITKWAGIEHGALLDMSFDLKPEPPVK